MVRAEDSGSGSDSGSDSSSDGGGSNDSGGGDNNNNGNDNGDNNNVNKDNGDRGPPGPSKEDKKDLTSDDPNVEPNLKPGDERCDIPVCKASEGVTPEHLPEPCHTPHCGDVGICSIGMKSPCNGPEWDHPPNTPVKIININIILKVIRGHSGNGHNSGSTHGISDACYTVMKQAWSGQIQIGQNSEIDKFMAGCLV